jgi:hypothetical protein
MTRLACLLLAFWAAASAAVATDCASDESNLLAAGNCSFDRDLAEWEVDPGGATAEHDAKEGSPRAGALRVDGGPQGSASVEGPCVPASPGTGYEVAVRLRAASGTPYFCGVNVFEYTDAKCDQGQEPLASASLPPEPDWQRATESATTGATTGSLRVRFACSGEPGFVVLVDDVAVSRR